MLAKIAKFKTWLRLQMLAWVLFVLGLLTPGWSRASGPPPIILVQPLSINVLFLSTASLSVTVSSLTTVSYQWMKNGTNIPGATSATLTLLSVGPSDAGSYCVQVTNGGGTVVSSTASISVLSAPWITTQPQSVGITQGGNVSFTVGVSGTAPFTYQWYSSNGAKVASGYGGNTATCWWNNVGNSQAGSYYAVVANSAGSVTSSVATLTVYTPPSITTQPKNLTVNAGQTANFSVAVSGSAPFTFQWYLGATPVPGATNASLAINNVNASEAGSYSVVVTNAGGSVTSQGANLTVNAMPVILVQPQSIVAAVGQLASFSVVATSSSGGIDYQWYFNSNAISGSQGESATLGVGTVVAGAYGSYFVVVANNYGSVTSQVATLSVPVAPAISAGPSNQIVVQNQPVTFSVSATGMGPLSYQWNFNGSALSGATNATLLLPSVQTNQAGFYTVTIVSPAGNLTSLPATLTVVPRPLASQIVSPAVAAACSSSSGFTMQFTTTPGTTNIIYATEDMANWHPISTNLATSTSVIIQDYDATNYARRFYKIVAE